jgi:formylglycine-generating enzyme
VLIVSILGLSALACSGSNEPIVGTGAGVGEGQACSATGYCPAGLSCVDGVCLGAGAVGTDTSNDSPNDPGDAGTGPAENQAPAIVLLEPDDGDVFSVGEVVQFVATFSDDQDPADQLTAFWTSSLDGNLGISLVAPDGSSSLNAYDLSPGVHVIDVRASDLSGAEGTGTLSVTINSAPTAPTVVLTPSEPNTTDNLVASISDEPTDVNRASDELSYSWEWYADGVLQDDLGGPLVDSEFTQRGEVWELRIAAFDGYAFGPEGVASVTIGNTPPACSSAQLSPETGDTSTSFQCRCMDRADPDDDPSVDSCVFYNGPSEVANAEAVNGVCLLNTTDTWRGMALSCSYTPGDGLDSGEAALSNEAVVINALPTQPEVQLSPAAGGGDTLFTCGLTVVALDQDNDPLTYTTRWFVNDYMNVGASSLSMTALDLHSGPDFTVAQRGDTLRCQVNADDGFDLSETGVSQDIVLGNSLPTADSVELSPLMVYEGQTITCSVEDPDDFDGDDITWSYAWTIDNVPLPGANESTLTSDHFERDDEMRCIATPYDGLDYGLPIASTPLTVQNTAPTLESVSIDPAEGPRSQNFTCSANTLLDADPDDLPSVAYSWFLSLPNGSATLLEGEVEPTLSGQVFNPGDLLTCRGTPSDGTLEGEPQLSDPTLIINLPPGAPTPTLSPTVATVTDAFSCSVDDVQDTEGDLLTLEYRWWVNDAPAPTVLSAETTASDLGAHGGDVIRCEVRAADAWDSSPWGTSALVTLDNTPPSGGTVTVSPQSPKEEDPLTCEVTGAVDLDGDPLSWDVSWTVNGQPAVGQADGTLTGAEFDKGQSVACTTVASDGLESGEVLVAQAVTVLNTLPLLEGLDISSAEVLRGDTIDCTWQAIQDPDPGDSTEVFYTWHQVVEGEETTLPDATEASLDAAQLLPGDQVWCRATPSDGEAMGVAVDSPVVTIINQVPSLTGASVSPDAPSGLDILTCVAEGYADGDDDSPVLSYLWSVDGQTLEEAQEATFAGTFYEGQSVACSIIPGDGFDVGEVVTSEPAWVTNAMPTLSSVNVSPGEGPPCEPFVCEVEGLFDPDPQDTPTLQLSWRVNNAPVPGDTDTLQYDSLSPGDVVSCHVTTRDGTLDDTGAPMDGPTFDSPPAEIINTPPTLASVTITPAAPEAGQLLTCVPEGFLDAECAPSPLYHVTWWIDGALAEGETETSLDTDLLPEGTPVSCEVSAFDGWIDGPTVMATAVVLLDPSPQPATVTVLAPDGPDGNLVCNVTSPATDDDPLNFTWRWWVGSNPEQPGGYSFPSSGLNACDRVFCRLTVSDGLHEVDSEPGSYQLPIGPPCTDDDVCTDNACGQMGGCLVTVNEAFCSDEDVCTVGDVCADGDCISGETSAPDDGVDCTLDGCEPGIGVTHAPMNGLCATDALCVTATCDVTLGCTEAPVADCCGNGIVEADEDCDDGNSDEGDGCSPTCTVAVAPPGMITIPQGPFWMGCNDTLLDAPGGCAAVSPSALPAHQVHLDTFFIDRHEVTVGYYRACIDAGVCVGPQLPDPGEEMDEQCNWLHGDRDDHPINFVSWEQAHTFCAWLGGRLPTEAEWEKAATGGCEHHGAVATCQEAMPSWPWGLWPGEWSDKQSSICDYAVMNDACEDGAGCCTGLTSSVGSLPSGASPYGVLDMAGNVSEWVSDWYDEGFYESSPDESPTGPPTGVWRAHRGGSFLSSTLSELTTSARNPGLAQPASMGFRCVRDPEGP